MAKESKKVPTYGIRKRFRGRMVRSDGQPRGSTDVHQPSKVSYECGQDHPYNTKNLPGRFKVHLPRTHIRVVKPGGCRG